MPCVGCECRLALGLKNVSDGSPSLLNGLSSARQLRVVGVGSDLSADLPFPI